MKLEGTITQFDPTKRTGVIGDSTGKQHLVGPESFRRTVRLSVGDAVFFSSYNLLNGPCARDVEHRGPNDSPKMAGVRASQVPALVSNIAPSERKNKEG